MSTSMNDTVCSERNDHSSSKRRLRRLLLLPVLVVLALTGVGGPAFGYSVSSTGSYPGKATVPVAQLTPPVSTCNSTSTQCTIDLGGPYLTSSARTIYENPTYGKSYQYVCITHRLLRWTPPTFSLGVLLSTGGWVVDQVATPACGYISPAQTAIKDAGHTFDIGNRGYCKDFSLDVIVTWRLQTGAVLGKKVYNYSDSTDYRISSGVALCATGTVDGRAYVATY